MSGVMPIDIWNARSHLKEIVMHTPIYFSHSLSKIANCQVFLKMECWQLCGSFKVRGAINMVAALKKKRSLVTCSSGNHGIALAFAGGLFGYSPIKIFLPKNADSNKLNKLKELGAEAILIGDTYRDTMDKAIKYAEENDAIYVHSHDHPFVIAGQGTIGLEILEDLPSVETILVPIGGGGLISGIATAIKSSSQEKKIIGIEPVAAPGAYMSFRDNYCHERIDLNDSIADGLLGTLTQLTWQISRNLVESIVLVEEEEIIKAMKIFKEEEQLIVEGAAAVGLAAILSEKIKVTGQKVVLVITGRNINTKKYNSMV